MSLAGTRLRRIFFGATILTFAAALQAASFHTEIDNQSSSLSQPPSVLSPGSRLLVSDAKKGEFYILGKDQPDPVIKNKGPAFVNAEPLQAGIDAHSLLGREPQDTVNVSDLLHEDVNANDDMDAILQKHQHQEEVSESAQSAHQDQQKIESRDNANLSKVKTLLHHMTGKMAAKKTHAKTHIAFNLKRKKLAKIHTVRQANKKIRNKTELAVVKIKCIHLG